MSTKMISTEINAQIQAAVLDYFAGERREMLLILGGSLLVTALTLWLWMVTRTGFAAAFAITVVAAAILFSGTAVSLLVRDKALSNTVMKATGPEIQAATLAAERVRIAVVLSKYPYYRYAAAGIALVALLGLMLSSHGWIHGVAAGLFILVVAQVLIDHYSERRGASYLESLTPASSVQGL